MAEVKKKEVAKVEETKATKEVAVEPKVAEEKEPAKKTTTKTATKATAKTTTKKPAAKKATEKIVIQFAGSEFDLDAVKASVKDAVKAEKIKATDLKIYIKPEDNKAYYVAGESTGSIDL